MGHTVLPLSLQKLTVHHGKPLLQLSGHHALLEILGYLNIDGNIQPELAEQDTGHDGGGVGITNETDAFLRKGDTDGENTVSQLVLIASEKALGYNADAFCLLQKLGDVVLRKQLGRIVGEELDVGQLVGLGDLFFDAVQLVLLHKTGEIHLYNQLTVFLIGLYDVALLLTQDRTGGVIGGVAVQNFQYGFHVLSLFHFCGGCHPAVLF